MVFVTFNCNVVHLELGCAVSFTPIELCSRFWRLGYRQDFGSASLFGVLLLLGNESLIVISLNFHAQLSFLSFDLAEAPITGYCLFPSGLFSWCSFVVSFHRSNVSGFQSQIPYLASSVSQSQRCCGYIISVARGAWIFWPACPFSFLFLFQRRRADACLRRLGLWPACLLHFWICCKDAVLACACRVWVF